MKLASVWGEFTMTLPPADMGTFLKAPAEAMN
jgi:hypothetical protein